MTNADHKDTESSLQRKPYAKPRLTMVAKVKDIVQGGGGTKAEPGTGARTKTCWIAEALYGIDAPRTLLVRNWLTQVYDERRIGWWLVRLYQIVGPSAARLIARGRLPRHLLLPLFDFLVVKAGRDAVRRIDSVR